MALTFKKVEQVQFDNIKESPVLTQERRLRIVSLKMSENNREKICETLASCFEKHGDEIKEFMLTNMSLTHLAKLQAYIIDGDDGLKEIEQRTKLATQETIKRALDDYEAKMETENE